MATPAIESTPNPPAPETQWPEPMVRLRRGAAELISHGTMAALMLLGFKGLELLIRVLWGKDKVLLGKIPIAYIFDAGDGLLLVGFLTIGVLFILRAYYREPK